MKFQTRSASKPFRSRLARVVFIMTLPAAAWISTVCSSVDFAYLKPQYEQKEKHSLKRIVLAMDPSSFTNERVGKLVLAVSRDYLSVQRDYIIYPTPKTSRAAPPWPDYCAANRKINGVLRHKVRLLRHYGDSTDFGVQVTLFDCKSGDRIWDSYGEDDYASNDPDLKTVISSYANRVSPEYRYLIGPTYLLVREIFESLPNPVLTEKEKEEKID